METYIQNIEKPWLLSAWTICFCLFRPSIPGESYNALVFILFSLLTFILYVKSNRTQENIKNRKEVLFWVLLTQSYFLFQGLILGDAPKDVINSSMVVIGTSIYFYLIATKERIPHILKALIYFHFILGISLLISVVYLVAINFDYFNLPIVARLHTYSKGLDLGIPDHIIFFPFTIIWSGATINEIQLPRFVGIYREPGVAQIFFVTSFLATFFIRLARQKLIRYVILIASLLTFSTATFLSLTGGIIALLFYNRSLIAKKRSKIFLAVGIICLVLIGLFLPNAGILDKVDSNSGRSRSDSYERSFAGLRNNFVFGQGYFSGFKKSSDGIVLSDETLGLIGVAFQIGVIGLILYLTMWYKGATLLGSKSTRCLYIPTFLSLLLSQPIYVDVIVYFIIFIDTTALSIVKDSVNITPSVSLHA